MHRPVTLDDQLQDVMTHTRYLQLGVFLDDPPLYHKLLRTLKDPRDENVLMYDNNRHINMYLDRIKKQNKSCTKALVSDYATKLACMRHLLAGLEEARLLEAAAYVREDILKIGPPPRPPDQNDSDSFRQFIGGLEEDHAVVIPQPEPAVPRNQMNLLDDLVVNVEQTVSFPYAALERATGGFSQSCRIGAGGFGDVFYARLGSNQVEVAIKRLKSNVTNITDTCLQKQINSEVRLLASFIHPNILRVLGWADDTAQLCVVYPYMSNGALNDHLQLKEGRGPLSGAKRMAIAVGIARGLNCLHTSKQKPFVHRDIKSANILLTADLIPVIGDFGFARFGRRTEATQVETKALVSCNGYIPPEFRSHNDDIRTQKDVYCYGVILLELLTGRLPYDESQRTRLLTDQMEAVDRVDDILDPRAGSWTDGSAAAMWRCAWRCLEYEPEERPTMEAVLFNDEDGLTYFLPERDTAR